MSIHEPLRLLRIPHGVSNSCTSRGTASSYRCQAEGGQQALQETDDIFFNGVATVAEGGSIVTPWLYTARNTDVSVIIGLIDALRRWYKVLKSDAEIISRCIELIHISSVMLDDTETATHTRRGRPAAHALFGVTQTVQSSKFMTIKGIKELAKLKNAECMRMLLDEIVRKSFSGGQQHIIMSTSVDDHIEDLKMKSGSIIRLVDNLMIAASAHTTHDTLDHDHLIDLFSRLYAVRDDYANLVPVAPFSTLKSRNSLDSKIQSFYMALDEGKYSLLLAHALTVLPADKAVLLERILMHRRDTGLFKTEHKALILEILRGCASLEFGVGLIRDLQGQILHALDEIEVEGGSCCLDEGLGGEEREGVSEQSCAMECGVGVEQAGHGGTDIGLDGFRLLVQCLGV